MSLLSRFQLDQGIQVHGHSQGGLFFPSSPLGSPRATPPPWGAQLPPQYTPSASGTLRRPRSSSGDNMMAEQHAAKRNRRFVTDVCKEYELPGDTLDNFSTLKTNEMLVVLFANLLAIERSRVRDDTSMFIQSKQFKDIMKDRMRSCLLSPNLTGYLSDLPDSIWSFMKRNPALFKIPLQALEDPELTEFIDSLMKDVLTKQRSSFKTKISTAINTQMHISHLAKSLAPPGYYEVTTAQWARFAFLRASLETFNTLVDEAVRDKVTALESRKNDSADEDDDSLVPDEDEHGVGKEKARRSWNPTNFWEYVDSLLVEVRNTLEQESSTVDECMKKYDEFFTACLQRDLKKYPTGKKNAGIPAVDRVTSELHRTIHEHLSTFIPLLGH